MCGSIAGFLVFFVFYWLGGMGGGDVKLMAGLGAVLGIERLWAAALWTAVQITLAVIGLSARQPRTVPGTPRTRAQRRDISIGTPP